MIEFEVTLRSSDLFDYNMKHSYSNPVVVLASALACAGVAIGIYKQNYPLLVIAVFLLVYQPATLFIRCFLKGKLPIMKTPFRYTMSDEGVTVEQGEHKQTLPWEHMYKASSTGKSILLYSSPAAAFVFPRDQLGDKEGAVILSICTHMDPAKVRIKS
ncbi:MAG: YcxB family protein [Lachnospiraceae bacterium]|nr:YcxB family protein [Lachnospiraceae bacterium]